MTIWELWSNAESKVFSFNYNLEKSALDQEMNWHRLGAKPFLEPMMTKKFCFNELIHQNLLYSKQDARLSFIMGRLIPKDWGLYIGLISNRLTI